MPKRNSSILFFLCQFLIFAFGERIEKEALIDVATIKDLEVPWMWVSPTEINDVSHVVELIDVVKNGTPTKVRKDGPVGPDSKSQPRFIGNLKNKLCKVGLGIGCNNINSHVGMDKVGRPIIPQDINYVQPLVIQAVGRPIPAIPATDPNYGNMGKPDYNKKNKRPPQVQPPGGYQPQAQTPLPSPGYGPVGQYSTPPVITAPPGVFVSHGGQEFANNVRVPQQAMYKLPVQQSFQVGGQQHTIISMDPMTTYFPHSFPMENNALLSNGGGFISSGNGHGGNGNEGNFIVGGQIITNSQPMDGGFVNGGQFISNGQLIDGNFVNGGHAISSSQPNDAIFVNGGHIISNDNNFANSHLISSNSNGNTNNGNFIHNNNHNNNHNQNNHNSNHNQNNHNNNHNQNNHNSNHNNHNNNHNQNSHNNNIGADFKGFLSNQLTKADLTNIISVPGNGLFVPSSNGGNKFDSHSFSVPLDLNFDSEQGSKSQSFDSPSSSPEANTGTQIFKAQFNAIDLPSSERPKKEAPHFPFSHDVPPPHGNVESKDPPAQVVQHIHVHKHVHQMDDGTPDTLAKRIQGNLDIISTPAFKTSLRGPESIREFLEQNEKPPFKRKVDFPLHPKLPVKQAIKSDNGGTCSCVLKDKCPIENIVETASREDISFMQDPRNKRSGSKILSTSNQTSVHNTKEVGATITTTLRPNAPTETEQLSSNETKLISNQSSTQNPKSFFKSSSQNAIEANPFNPQQDRKILLNIKRTKRDVSHLFDFENSFNLKNLSSALDLEFPSKRHQSHSSHHQSRSDLPFSCGLHEVCCNLDSFDLSLVGTPLSSNGGRSCGSSVVNAAHGRIKTTVLSEGEAKFGEFPWQAAILKKEGADNVYICAGTFIDESHVLTAAHCVQGYKATQLRVRLGEWDVNRDTEFYPHIEYDAIGVAIHPDFFSGNLINDIALIRMLYPVDMVKNPHISPICLPVTGADYSGRRCWVSGWGKNGFGKNGKYQNLLKKVDVPVVPRQICQDILRETRLGPDYFLHQGMMCAGGEPEKDACKGDGGGPLSCPDVHGNFVLVGIVSWGIGCGQQGVPGVYTNVEHYRPWISKMIESK